MKNLNNIENAVARFWTSAELRVTIKMAEAAGLKVFKDEDMTTIMSDDKVILRSLNTGQGTELVRLNKNYFEY